MGDTLKSCIEVLLFLKELIGLRENITIDSNIFKHYGCGDGSNGLLDESKDIVKIYGRKKGGITMDDIIDAFQKMEKQFAKLEKNNLYGRSYYFEGFECITPEKEYEICWGS